MHRGFRIHALAQKFVFLDQANFLRHAPQEQPQLFQRRKRLGDVVVGAKLHGLHRGFDRAVSGHERNLGARQKLFYLLQKLQPRHVRHHHVGQHHVDGLLFEQRQRRLPAFRLQADEAESLADGDAEFADTLLVVDDQQANAKIFFTSRVIHSDLPKSLRNDIDKLLHAERFLHAGSTGLMQSGDRFFVGNVAGNKNDSRSQIGAVAGDPGMHLASVHAAGRAHVGHHAQECCRFRAGGEHPRPTRSTPPDIRCAPGRLAHRP